MSLGTNLMPKNQSVRAERQAVFTSRFRDDLRYWAVNDRRILLRLLDLIEAVIRDPFTGIGKPESLKFKGADTWSRRLTQEHRIVYLVEHQHIRFLQARFHY